MAIRTFRRSSVTKRGGLFGNVYYYRGMFAWYASVFFLNRNGGGALTKGRKSVPEVLNIVLRVRPREIPRLTRREKPKLTGNRNSPLSSSRSSRAIFFLLRF